MNRTTAGMVLGLGMAVLLGAAWNNTYELVPDGSDLASDLDSFIKGFKVEVRQRAEVEHQWGGSTDDNGLHAMGSARCFVQNAAPTAINSATAALGQYNSSAGTDGGTALTTDEVGAATRDLGAGRCWVDLDGPDNIAGNLDDRLLHVWDETADAFVAMTTRDVGASGIGASNQLYNGSFEVTDGTGAVASTTAPAGWSNLDTSLIEYADPTSVTEDAGLLLRVTADGGLNEGVRATLTSLKASTTYVYRVRAKSPAAGTCNILVGDGTTSATASTTSGTFALLEVTHTTTAVPAAVTFDLRSAADGDICDWDHATVFERNATVRQSGIVVCRDTDATVASDAYSAAGWVDALVSCAVTPPGPGYVVQVRGQVVADNEDASDSGKLVVRLRQNGATTLTMGLGAASPSEAGANDLRDLVTTQVFYTAVSPTPGTTLTYTMEARTDDSSSSMDRNIGDVAEHTDLDDSANLVTTLEVIMTPTR